MSGKKSRETGEAGRLNVTLPPELDQRLNSYILKYGQKHGRIPHGIRTKIARLALEEWLERNGNNFDIKF